MVIARGCGGRDWRELLHRDSIEGEEKFWQWMVGNDCAKCRLDTIELYTLIVTMADALIRVNGKCSIMCTLSH